LGARAIVAGFNAEEARTFPDNSEAFVRRANAYLEFATRARPRIESPTIGMTKREIVRAARRLALPLAWCWPCYEGGEQWCGQCESCVRFARAIEEEELAPSRTDALTHWG
ncbi:MAG: 7-cyano-7-deazaguanine synthase, partial [Deltaproteobacteria bacterium]|nr:7-cyano-7-deazaguanine synthase [Deltaproteobacteria bacterium]